MEDQLTFRIERSNIGYELLNKISLSRNISLDIVEVILRYNILTPIQLSVITGKNPKTIINLLKTKEEKDGTFSLTKIYPWKSGDDLPGPIFVLLDIACMRYINKSLDE
jgi:hypothetical protein